MFHLLPDVLLADKDDEKEESSQHVAEVSESEEDLKTSDGLTGFPIMLVEDEMNTLNSPQNPKD